MGAGQDGLGMAGAVPGDVLFRFRLGRDYLDSQDQRQEFAPEIIGFGGNGGRAQQRKRTGTGAEGHAQRRQGFG